MKKTIISLKKSLFLLFVFLGIPGCIRKKDIDKQKLFIDLASAKTITPPIKPPPITIWVHGTLIFRKPSYHSIFQNKTKLVPILSLPEEHHFRTLTKTIHDNEPNQFPLEEFYIFSWSGKLHNQVRKEAAQKLYNEIVRIYNEYQQKYGCDPTVTIITHSHGGNVVLKMAKIKNADLPFTIASLILLACPVQEKTKHLINNALFKRVYSLSSSLDIIQILAPQFKLACTTNPITAKPRRHYCIPPFSSRLFPSYSHLTQAKIRINGFPISHTHFSTRKFVALLPTIVEKLDQWHGESAANNSIRNHKLLCVYKIIKN
jgi:hypothetical protein